MFNVRPLLVSAMAVLAACGGPGEDSPNGTQSSATSPDPAGPPDERTPAPNEPTLSATDASVPALTGCSENAAPQPVDADWPIVSSGTSRTMHVHVPRSVTNAAPAPLVLNFHGYTSDATQQMLLSGLNAKADAAGFIAVHPQGISQSWNAGACCGEATSKNIDDVQFVRDMLDALSAKLCIDPKRVFATGMSNGAFLSHRLACELSTRIAAIAPVAGVLGVPTCNPTRPVPVMEFHGKKDTTVPYGGRADLGYEPVPTTFANWAKRDGCTGDPTTSYEHDDTTCSSYTTCNGGAVVTLCTSEGGGHTWPGGIPVPWLGPTSKGISATDAMWDFFRAHPLP